MKTRRKESGFAMLLVFLMAACVAITLYMEVPRVAFEAERQRELLLVSRGAQFKRAIQVFVTDKVNNPTGRYPASIEELENFNNHRHLRRRYLDPMTGKDEWRLIHINGGVLTDSVTTQTNPANASQSTSSIPNGPEFISTQAFIDSNNGGAARGGGVAAVMRGRPSDSQAPGGDPNATVGGAPGSTGYTLGSNPAGQPPNGLPPGGVNGQNGTPNQSGIPGIPGVPGVPGTQPGGQTAAPCTAFIGSCTPTTQTGGQTGQSGQPQQNGQSNGVAGMPGNQPGLGPTGMPGGPQAMTAAAGMLNNLLTTPRPGGMPSIMPGATIGGGIAGVASKYEAEGIMVINDKTAINDWEYIFDKTKWRAPPNPVNGSVGTALPPMQGGSTGTPIGGAPPGSTTPTGSNMTTGTGH